MMASPFHPPQLVASGSTYSPLDSPYSSFSSPRYEHPSTPASTAPSSSSSAAFAPHERPCMHSNGSVYSDISDNEDFDFSDPAPLSSVPSPAILAPSGSAPKPKAKTPLASASTSRPLFRQSDSVLSDLSPSEDLDFSDPAADAAAASRALPTPPPAPAARRPLQRFSPDGYPFPWVLSRPATPPSLLPPSSAFSTPSSSGQNTPGSAPSHSPFINDVEAQTTTLTAREINSHGSRPLPDTPAAEIPTTPAEHVQSRGRHAGSTPGCNGPLPMVSHEEDQEEQGEGLEATPKQTLRRRKSANALLAARMMGGLSSAGVSANQPLVASPLREVVE